MNGPGIHNKDYPIGSVITTEKGTLGKFRLIFEILAMKLSWKPKIVISAENRNFKKPITQEFIIRVEYLASIFEIQLFLGKVISNSNMQSVFGLFNSMIHIDFYQFLYRNNVKPGLFRLPSMNYFHSAYR